MRITEIEINYAEPTFPGGMTVEEMQNTLKDIDWLDGEQVAQEAGRCNERCGDNTVRGDIGKVTVDTGEE